MNQKLSCVIALTVCLCMAALADEQVKIVDVLDTNLFRTDTGERIALANVKTISINNPDSMRQVFARALFEKVKDTVQGRRFLLQSAVQTDSLRLVYMWEMLPLDRVSVNKAFLERGWGTFVLHPSFDYTKEFQQAAADAASKQYGMHDPGAFKPKILPHEALWLSAGLGVGAATDHRRRGHYNTDCYLMQLSAHIRNTWLVYSGGYNVGAPYGEAHLIRTGYLLVGASLYDTYGEMALSIGPNLNKWEYDTESSRGTVNSEWYPGLHLKAQLLAHLPVSFGLGIQFDANINKDISYYVLSFNLMLGGWNYD